MAVHVSLGGWSFAAVMLIASAAAGSNYYVKSGVTDWSQASSYCTDAARTTDSTVLPGENDTIHAPAETFTFDSSTATGLASIETISNVYQIMTSQGTTLIFVIPSGEVGVGCRIRYSSTSTGVARINSTIVKQGAGTLDLQATSGDSYLYAANLDVQAGVLKVCQGTSANQYMGELKLASGATIWMPCMAAGVDSATQSYFDRIMAEENSVITNATTRSSGHVVHILPASGTYDFESYVKGLMCGKVRIWSSGSIRLDGTNNIMSTVTVEQYNYGHLYSTVPGKMRGVILVKSIGLKGEPSSLGTADVFYGYGDGAGYRYTGFGEYANKNYCIYGTAGTATASGHQMFLDGGPHGGLLFGGSINLYADENNPVGVRRLWLIGEHTNECVISGPMGTMTGSGVTYPVYLTKSGTGTWRLTGSRDHRGVTAIAEGTLRFDSIAERGTLCSLGRSTICTTDDTRAIANSNYVGYAFVLGGGASDATFEYTGEGIGRCTTRPLVLAGNGGHLRASSGPLTFYGISARDTGSSPILTLDGTTQGCKAYNITNGAAGSSIGIVKDGTGSWELGGNLAVDGGIKVKQGSLAINSYTVPQSADYKWFRVSLAQIGANTNSTVYLRKICLFNSAGVRQNVGLTLPGSVTAHTYDAAQETKTVAAADIGKGEIWFDKSYAGKSLTYYKGSSDIDALCNNVFSNSEGSDGMIMLYMGTAPKPAQPATWLPIVMRLPDSADPIAKFDIQVYSDDRKLAPTRVLIEASHDGIAWDIVYSNVSAEDDLLAQQVVTGNYNRWISDGTTPNASKTATAAAPALSSSGGLVRECFSWYRLRFAKLGNGGNYLYVRQIGLFDQAGRRLNAGLEFVEEPGNTSEKRTIVGTMPGPGQVGYGYTGIGRKVMCVTEYTGELGNCFDGAFSGSGGRCNFYWYDSEGNSCTPTPSNENTWIPIVMHLVAPVAVHHFDIQAFSLNSLSYAPVRFMLEGSTDGETWHVLYNNATEGDALSNVPTDYNQWLSDCVSGSANNRPDGTGWNISASYATGNPYVQFANGLKAQVLSDGVLTTSGTLALNELTIDAASAGTIENFVFAQNGTVNLLNVNSTAVLPGSYTGCTGLENVANWAVTVNGRSRSRTRVVSEDGKLKLLVPGVSISFR